MKKIASLLFILFITSFSLFAQEGEVFVIVDHMPVFGEDKDAMQKFFLDEMKYPTMAARGGIKGKVHVSFIVNENGETSDVKILKGKPMGLNKEAIRLVETMPKWTPGKQGDETVKVQMTIQIEFPLELKAYKDDNKKIRCNSMPNIGPYGDIVYQQNQYFVWIFNKGVDALNKKKYKEAEAYFNQALEIGGPTYSSHPYFGRAVARYHQGNKSLACGDFRRARKLGYSEIDKTIKAVCPE